MKKRFYTILSVLFIGSLLATEALWCGECFRLKKEVENRADYETLCEEFITNYVKEVNTLRDYILRDEHVDSLILRIDACAFGFSEHSDLIEYNIYALDRNQYWDQFREE